MKDLPKVLTWQLERDSIPQAFGRNATNLPMSHRAPQIMSLCHGIALLHYYIPLRVYLPCRNSVHLISNPATRRLPSNCITSIQQPVYTRPTFFICTKTMIRDGILYCLYTHLSCS